MTRRRPAPRARAAALVVGALLATFACATPGPPALPTAAVAPAARPTFVFATDTLAFPNEIRSRHPGVSDLYANYCFVLARAVRQFHLYARFEPAAPPLEHDAYVRRVQTIASRAPWARRVSEDEIVVIPGYANLREFSRAEESAVKEGLGGRFWTLVHWTNWRVTMPVTAAHQRHVADEILAELSAGRLVQLLVTNWPTPELNHTLVAFDAHPSADGVDFVVWDPNDPQAPGTVTFDARAGRFVASHVYDTRPGPIRVFRMYYSAVL